MPVLPEPEELPEPDALPPDETMQGSVLPEPELLEPEPELLDPDPELEPELDEPEPPLTRMAVGIFRVSNVAAGRPSDARP